jgi:hypothetical protein
MSEDANTDWKSHKVSDFAEVVGGGTPSTRDPANFGNDIPWITPKDLSTHQSRYISRGDRSLSTKGLAGSSAKRLPGGTVLVSSRAPIGLTAIAQNEVSTNQGCRSLVVNADIADSEFVYYLMSASTEYLHQHANGTTFMELPGGVFKNLEFLLPPLADQRRIAAVLGALDERIETDDRIRRLLADAAQCIVAASPGSCSLSDVASAERVQWYPNKNDGKVIDHYSLPAFDGFMEPERVEASEIASNKLVVRGTRVLFSRLNPDTNRTWLCDPSADVDDSVCSTEYAVLVPASISVQLLWSALSSGEVGHQLAAATTGTSASHQRVSEAALLAATIPDPRAIGDSARETANQYVNSYVAKGRELKLLRQARGFLLPRLVSGEFRVAAAEELVEAAT